MYSISGFGEMMNDGVRMAAYEGAVAASVRPGAVVLDLGAGTGIMTLLACRAGARKVFAVEPSDALSVAEEIVRVNGYGDRVDFICSKSTDVTLPERVDVVLSDLRGVLPLFQQHIPAIIDARSRHVAPGGVLVPQRDELWVGLVEAAGRYEQTVSPWTTNRLGFDMTPGRVFVTNTWEKAKLSRETLLGTPARWATLDYTSVESTNVNGDVTLSTEREGFVHGLAVWFDAVLLPGYGFSNAPGAPETIYGRAFFPLFQPLAVVPGSEVRVALRADLVGDDYIWRWDATLGEPDRVSVGAPPRQSTFYGVPLSKEKLRKRTREFRPVLNQDGQLALYILEAVREGRSVDSLVTCVMQRFPHRFPTPADAIKRVTALCEEYSA